MSERDEIRLLHMLESAREAKSFAEDRSRQDLETDRQFALSVVKLLEIVGEAAGRVSPDTQSQALEIPWAEIVGMRNRLIHAYFDIDLDRVWTTLTNDLPPLIESLERLLGRATS
jgi:uncharacterized protein with HEPN domain